MKRTSSSGKEPVQPRDLADFHLRWPEFRKTALAATHASGLSAAERIVLAWLIKLADRVGPRDLI